MSETNLQLLFKPEQAAVVLGIGRSKVFELMARGDLASVQIGRARRIPRESLEDYVRRLRSNASLRDPAPAA